MLTRDLFVVAIINFLVDISSAKRKCTYLLSPVADWRSFAFTAKIFVSLLRHTRNAIVGTSSSEDGFPPAADTSLSMGIGLSADLLLTPFPMAGWWITGRKAIGRTVTKVRIVSG